jgi:hypothetical protein
VKMAGPDFFIGFGMIRFLDALVHSPPTRFLTAYGVAVSPSAAGSSDAHDGMTVEKGAEAAEAFSTTRRLAEAPRWLRDAVLAKIMFHCAYASVRCGRV